MTDGDTIERGVRSTTGRRSMRGAYSMRSLVWRRLRRHRLATASVAIVVAVSLLCLAAPIIAPYDVDQIDLGSIREPPSVHHLLGTDDLGRDLFTRLLYGGRVSILIGLMAAVIGTGFGALVGAVAGFYGGRVDGLLMRFTDVVYSIPTLPLLIVLASYTQAGAVSMAVAVGVLSWMAIARVVRGEVLKIREMEYVEAARSLGATNTRIIGRHVLPNAVGPIVVGATLAVGNAIILESSLSFLGLGVQPPTPTWGNMLTNAQDVIFETPMAAVWPGLLIFLTVISINLLGDSAKSTLDPKNMN